MAATRCAVLGQPVGHSLSPVLHRAAYDALGLEGWTYAAIEVDEAGLEGLLGSLDDSWRGLSLTMPLKRAVLPLLDSLSGVAEAAGAVNTVLLEDGLLAGDNTDVGGVIAAIRERYDGPLGSAVVIGGGATASSVLLALASLGCGDVTMLVRDAARASGAVAVAARAGGPLVSTEPLAGGPVEADIVVSTVPAEAQTPRLVDRLRDVPVVFEVVYDAWPTPLARSVGADRTLVGGLDLLVHQAALQVGLMTRSVDVPLRAMRAAGERALAARC